MVKNKSEVGHKTTKAFETNFNILKLNSIRKIEVDESENKIHGFFPFYEDASVNKNLKQTAFYKDYEKNYIKNLKNAHFNEYKRKEVNFESDEIIIDLTVSFLNEFKMINAIKIRTNKRNVYIGNKDNITSHNKQVLIKADHFISFLSSYYIINDGITYLSGISAHFELNNHIEINNKSTSPNVLVKLVKGIINLIFKIVRVIFILIVILIPFLYFYYASQNIIKGDFNVDNISSQVKIFTDEHGFAHIKAETREDASFSLGFVQARDRLWQMDLYRRLARGKLSEILGRKALHIDITTRQMGWGHLATKDYEFLKFYSEHESTLTQLQKFTEGVNYWVKTNFLPLEYKFLLCGFSDWTVVDSLAIMRFLNINLGQDYVLELFYVELDKKFGKDFADLVFSFRKGKFFNSEITVIPDQDMKKLGLFKSHVIHQNEKKRIHHNESESLKTLQNNYADNQNNESQEITKESIDNLTESNHRQTNNEVVPIDTPSQEILNKNVDIDQSTLYPDSKIPNEALEPKSISQDTIKSNDTLYTISLSKETHLNIQAIEQITPSYDFQANQASYDENRISQSIENVEKTHLSQYSQIKNESLESLSIDSQTQTERFDSLSLESQPIKDSQIPSESVDSFSNDSQPIQDSQKQSESLSIDSQQVQDSQTQIESLSTDSEPIQDSQKKTEAVDSLLKDSETFNNNDDKPNDQTENIKKIINIDEEIIELHLIHNQKVNSEDNKEILENQESIETLNEQQNKEYNTSNEPIKELTFIEETNNKKEEEKTDVESINKNIVRNFDLNVILNREKIVEDKQRLFFEETDKPKVNSFSHTEKSTISIDFNDENNLELTFIEETNNKKEEEKTEAESINKNVVRNFDLNVILNSAKIVEDKQRLFVEETDKPKVNSFSHTEKSTISLDFNDENNLSFDIINEGASNNWVISGNLTKSGKPILSNDPHLNNAIPTSIYPSKVYLPDNFLVGGSYPGVPFFVVGNNKYLSWGVTTENSDLIDICEEKIEGDQYYYENKLYDLQKIEEEILIKDEESHKFTVKWTRNGPLVDYFPGDLTILALDFKHFTNMSFRQPGNFFNNTTPIVMEKLNYDVKTIDELKKNMDNFISPSLHFVFATVDGDIGYSPLGKFPIKQVKRDGFCKGYSSTDKIDFFIPDNEKPFYVNPDKGFIVSANNKFSFNYKYDLNGYHYHNRAQRIDDLLNKYINENKKIDIQENIKILSDLFDVNAEYVVPRILKILERNGKSRLKHYNDLKNWDYVMSKDSVSATIYSVLELSIGENFLLHETDQYTARGLSVMLFYWDFINDLLERISEGETIELKQCAYYSKSRDCEKYFIKVFENLDINLSNFKDSNGNVKKWGEVHFNYYPSIFFDKIPVLKHLFSRKTSTGGNKNTIKVSKSKYIHAEGTFTSHHSASLKYICDLNQPEQPYLIVDTGVSGNYLNKYYDNFIGLNEENKLIKMAHHNFTQENLNRTIYLNPTKVK